MRFISPIIIIGCLAVPSQLLAQEVSSAKVKREVTPTDEIIVKGIYESDLLIWDVPASIDVLGAERLQNIAAVHPAEALNGVAGVNINRGSGQEHLTAIRSPVLTGGAGAGSFLYLEEGVPLRAAGFANVNGLFEGGTEFAQSLEVFKGPGPAQYGSNAVHGLINISSKDVGGGNSIKILGGEDGFVSGLASLSNGSFRLSTSLAHDDGFREDSGFDQQKLQLKYQGEFEGWSVDWLSSFNNLNQETAGFIEGDDAYKDSAVRFTNPNPEAFRDGKSYRTQARFMKDFGENTLSLTPYARRVELRFLRHFVPGQALEKNGHSSIGLQTALFGKDFNVGADIEYTDGFLFEFQDNANEFSFVQGLHYDYEVKSLVGAVYAQRDIALGAATTLDLGVRAEYTNYNYDNLADTGRSGRFIRAADREDDFLTVTPKVSLRHHLNDRSLVYLRAARGSRAPQVTDLYSAQLNQVPGEADVETLDSLEAGFKKDFGNAEIELAAYTQWKDNFFFRNANGFNVVDGKTRHSGIEASFSVELTEWLRLSGDGTLAKHTYDFTLDEGSPANNITKGDRVDTAPDTLATLRVTARPNNVSTLELEWRHVGSYFTNPGNTEAYSGHDIFVLRGDYALTGTVKFQGRIDNLFDKHYADRADFAFGNERYFPGRPRTLFFGVSADF